MRATKTDRTDGEATRPIVDTSNSGSGEGMAGGSADGQQDKGEQKCT